MLGQALSKEQAVLSTLAKGTLSTCPFSKDHHLVDILEPDQVHQLNPSRRERGGTGCVQNIAMDSAVSPPDLVPAEGPNVHWLTCRRLLTQTSAQSLPLPRHSSYW